jgi:hypothetical protein
MRNFMRLFFLPDILADFAEKVIVFGVVRLAAALISLND